jgi:magnesium transporter
MSGIVNCAAYSEGRRVGDVQISGIREILKQPDRFVWLGLHEPDQALLREVQQELGLHDLAIEDAHTAHQRPKLERYDDSLFIVLRTARWSRERRQIDLGETHFFIGARYMVSIRHGSLVSYKTVRAHAETTPHLLSKGPGFVLYALMDFLVDQYFPVVDSLEDDMEAFEKKIIHESLSREETSRMYALKRDLLELKRAVSPLVDICSRLTRLDLEPIPADTRPYYRDVYDHTVRINERLDGLRESLSAVLEANLFLAAVAQNEATKKLAGWAAIVAVPTMVGTIYGMNFEFMPELRWRFGYPMVMVVSVFMCAFLYSRFKRAGWL